MVFCQRGQRTSHVQENTSLPTLQVKILSVSGLALNHWVFLTSINTCTSCPNYIWVCGPLGPMAAPSPYVQYHSYTQVLKFFIPGILIFCGLSITLAANLNHLAYILFCVSYTRNLSCCKTVRFCKSTISIVICPLPAKKCWQKKWKQHDNENARQIN